MRLKLIPLITIFTAVILALATLATYFYFSQNINSQLEDHISRAADDFFIQIAKDPEAFVRNPQQLIKLPGSREFSASDIMVQFMDPNGQEIARSDRLRVKQLPFTLGEDNLIKDIKYAEGSSLKVYQRRVIIDAENLGYIITAASSAHIYHSVDLFRKIFFVSMLCTLLILAIGLSAFTSLDLLNKQKKFLSFASHELRIPLSVIAGNAEVALRHTQKPAGYRQALSLIREESIWMNRIVSDLLHMFRQESGVERIKKVKFNLSDLAIEEVTSLWQRYPHKKVNIDFPPEVIIKADPAFMRRILSNLLENSCRHTAEQGQIDLRISQEANQVELEIRDTGAGIPPEKLKKLFKPYYRSNLQKSDGFGLGLAIVKSAVEAHRGLITVKSRPRRGTQFNIIFPQ